MTVASKQRILVAPLDWGLGHATRCVPLIDRWLSEGHEVILASNGRSAAWLRLRYPQLEVISDIPDYAVTYPASGHMTLHFIKDFKRLRRVVRNENKWLQEFIEKHAIDCVYSDNRYGLHNPSIECTLITHQLYLQVPRWSKGLVYGFLNHYLRQFNSIWIPDNERDPVLSGALSHGGSWDKRVKFIGPLSRFATMPKEQNDVLYSRGHYEIIALVSGPEPRRTMFEHKLRELLLEMGRPSLLILGRPEQAHKETKNNLTIINHLPDSDFAHALQSAQLILCRSGYSTIMDLAALKVRALLIPTPGQTEQEYLAHYLAEQGIHDSVLENQLTKEKVLTYLQRSNP